MLIRKTIEMKLNVRPVFIGFVHDYVYEGPCRFGSGDELTKKFDQMTNQEAYRGFCDIMKKNLSSRVNLLEPIYVERNEEFPITEEALQKMGQDSGNADVYIFGQAGRGYDMIVEFGQRYRKPIMLTGMALATSTTIAALKARGLEAYATADWQDIMDMLDVMRVRKVLRDSRILLAPVANSNISFSATDSFLSLEKVTEVLGTRFRYVSAHELIDQTRPVAPDSNPTLPGRMGLNPDEADMKEIKRITDELVGGATECHMERELVENSVRAFHTVKKFLEHCDCSAFSMPCPDMCATRRLNQEKITFCLTHSLLNEEGIPSGCEYDIPALLAMIVLMNFAGSAPYMGNTIPTFVKNGRRSNITPAFFQAEDSLNIDVPELGETENVMLSFHAVPNRQMHGFGCGKSSYTLRSFARGQGFGATIRYDFKKDKGQPVTLCRFDLNCSRIFVARGTIVGGVGFTDQNCSEGVFYTVKDNRDFFKKQCEFGNHVPLVYGDCYDKVKALVELLGLEVVEA
jgi:L-fucose isomerase-like protein